MNMTPKSKAFELINKVSYEMEQLPYSFCKALAKLICDEIMCINIGTFNGNMPVKGNELCADGKYWIEVKKCIDLA